MRRRVLLSLALMVALAVAAVWHWQSELIGLGARWYLARIAAAEESTADLTRRRAMVGQMNRTLLLAAPAEPLVPELFDLMTEISGRVATGEIDFAWAAYVYTSYQRDLLRDRPTGTPRRSRPEVVEAVQAYVRFYSLQRRPDATGVRLGDLSGTAGESYSLEEIRAAAREGHDLARVPTPSR